MRHYLDWRKALGLSTLINGGLLIGLGWLSPLTVNPPEPTEVIEMELTDQKFPEVAALQSQVSQEQILEPPLLARQARGYAARPANVASNAVASEGIAGANTNADVQADPYSESNSSFMDGTESTDQGNNKVQNSIGTEKAIIQPPQVRQKVEPVYPKQARKLGWAGEVLVQVEVLTTGGVGEVKIARSSGYSSLDEAAVQAVRQWRFYPAINTASGLPVYSKTTVPVRFNLNSRNF